jgi:hypothetical protein
MTTQGVPVRAAHTGHLINEQSAQTMISAMQSLAQLDRCAWRQVIVGFGPVLCLGLLVFGLLADGLNTNAGSRASAYGADRSMVMTRLAGAPRDQAIQKLCLLGSQNRKTCEGSCPANLGPGNERSALSQPVQWGQYLDSVATLAGELNQTEQLESEKRWHLEEVAKINAQLRANRQP